MIGCAEDSDFEASVTCVEGDDNYDLRLVNSRE